MGDEQQQRGIANFASITAAATRATRLAQVGRASRRCCCSLAAAPCCWAAVQRRRRAPSRARPSRGLLSARAGPSCCRSPSGCACSASCTCGSSTTSTGERERLRSSVCRPCVACCAAQARARLPRGTPGRPQRTRCLPACPRAAARPLQGAHHRPPHVLRQRAGAGAEQPRGRAADRADHPQGERRLGGGRVLCCCQPAAGGQPVVPLPPHLHVFSSSPQVIIMILLVMFAMPVFDMSGESPAWLPARACASCWPWPLLSACRWAPVCLKSSHQPCSPSSRPPAPPRSRLLRRASHAVRRRPADAARRLWRRQRLHARL